MAVYSDHGFLPWLFNITPKGFFLEKDNRLRFVEWLRIKVGARDPNDLKYEDFMSNHGGRLLALYGGSPQLVLDSLMENQSEQGKGRRAQLPKNFWVPFLFFNSVDYSAYPLSLVLNFEPKAVSGLSWVEDWSTRLRPLTLVSCLSSFIAEDGMWSPP